MGSMLITDFHQLKKNFPEVTIHSGGRNFNYTLTWFFAVSLCYVHWEQMCLSNLVLITNNGLEFNWVFGLIRWALRPLNTEQHPIAGLIEQDCDLTDNAVQTQMSDLRLVSRKLGLGLDRWIEFPWTNIQTNYSLLIDFNYSNFTTKRFCSPVRNQTGTNNCDRDHRSC